MVDSEMLNPGSEIKYKGSCACGRITYACTSVPPSSECCNCVTCRKLSGGPYMAFVSTMQSDVLIYDTKDGLKYDGLPLNTTPGIHILRFSNVADRAFCATCYCQLAMRYGCQQHRIGLTLGTVDEESVTDAEVKEALKPRDHIFTSQAPWWYDCGKDGIFCHDRFSADFELQLQTRIEEVKPSA